MSRFPVLAITLISLLFFIIAAASATNPSGDPLLRRNIGIIRGLVKPLVGRNSMDREFVAAHNAIRLAHNVKPLTWNGTLARYARRWANERIDDCELMHSPDSPYGENIFWSADEWSPAAMVKVWGDEVKNYNPQTNECVDNSMCGHYTQIVWKTSERVGCGGVKCDGNRGYFYVCSYDPPGNYYYEGPFGGHFTKSIVYP